MTGASADLLIGKPARRLRDLAGGWAPLVVVLAILCATPAYMGYVQWSEVRALRRAWTFTGPPCPVVQTPASWAVSHRRPPKVVDYRGVRFTRAFAAISCAAVPEAGLWSAGSYTGCQFNNPGSVGVTAAGRTTIFQPPAGSRITVTVRDDRVSCVVGGNFNGQADG